MNKTATTQRNAFLFSLAWAESIADCTPKVRLEIYDAIVRFASGADVGKLSPVAEMAFKLIRREMEATTERYAATS